MVIHANYTRYLNLICWCSFSFQHILHYLTPLCMCVYICTCTYVCVCVHEHICVCLCLCVYMYICMYVCVCVCVCVCVSDILYIFQYVSLRIFLAWSSNSCSFELYLNNLHFHRIPFIFYSFFVCYHFLFFHIYECLASYDFFKNTFLAGLSACLCHQRTSILISDLLMIYLSLIDTHIHQQVAHGPGPRILGNKHLGLLFD